MSSCAYCESEEVSSLVKCLGCSKHFCNSSFRSQGSSHIVLHMARSRHFSVRLVSSGRRIRCTRSLCQNENPFTLGGSSLDSLRCRAGCGDRVMLTEAQLNALPPMISLKSFVPTFLSERQDAKVANLTFGVIERLELEWRDDEDVTVRDLVRPEGAEAPERDQVSKIPIVFGSPLEYVRTFLPMLNMELRSSERKEKIDSGRLIVNSCLWDPICEGWAVLRLKFDAFKIKLGQEVRLILPNYPTGESQTIWLAEVKEIGNMELVIFVDNDNGRKRIPPVNDPAFTYLLHVDAWTEVVFERMKHAVCSVLTDSVSPAIIRPILRGAANLPAPSVATEGLDTPFARSSRLNDSQNRAVVMALHNPVSLIQGPPGTGKSTVSVEIVRRAVSDGKVLVCAPSNIVADHLAEKISELTPRVDVIRVAARSREIVETTVNQLMLHTVCSFEDSLYKTRKRQLRKGGLKPDKKKLCRQYCRRVEVQRIRRAAVVVMTCVCAGDERVSDMSFHTVIIDEATQTVEPGCLIPITMATSRVVLIGDHKQLGPVVHNDKAKRAGFDISMFQRLIGLNLPMTRLDIQYRMHPAISAFSCEQFYGGTLVDGVSAAQRTKANAAFPWPSPKLPIFFWHVPGQEELDSRGNSYLNRHEAIKVQEVVTRLLVDSRDVGVITFYSAQKELLMSKFPGSASGTPEIASVDGFQGREKDYIVLSTVRADDIGFLREYRRLNVAMTRAKYGLVICGNVHTMLASKDETWLALLAHLNAQNAIFGGASLAALQPLVFSGL